MTVELRLNALFAEIDECQDGYGWLPYPNSIDVAAGRALDLATSSPAAALQFRASLNPRSALLMIAFARRLAVQAVLNGDSGLVRRGVAAIALAGDRFDSRDATLVLHLLAHSAKKVGVGHKKVFASAVAAVPFDVSSYVTTFAKRRSATSIDAAGFTESTDVEGRFTYVSR